MIGLGGPGALRAPAGLDPTPVPRSGQYIHTKGLSTRPPVGSIAKCESPTFAGVCTSEALLARSYRQLDLDARRTLFRLTEARRPTGEIAERLGRHPSTVYRELGRNRFRDGDRGFCGYFPLNAQDLARRRRQRR